MNVFTVETKAIKSLIVGHILGSWRLRLKPKTVRRNLQLVRPVSAKIDARVVHRYIGLKDN